MKASRTVPRPDTSAWPEFDPGTLTATQRKTFDARRRAIEMFVIDTSLTEIEAQTGINRRQVYRSLESAAALHADGRPYGWRALVPHTRVGDYRRLAKVRRHPVGLGTAGAFGLLLGAHLSVSLQAVTFALSCCHRVFEQVSRFSGLGIGAHAHMVIQGHGDGTGRFAPFIWHNLAFDPFNLSPSAKRSARLLRWVTFTRYLTL